MEESRCKSRVAINDQVYESIQQRRYQKHIEALARLRSLDRKSNSHYLLSPYPVEVLDKAKKAQLETIKRVFPPDVEYKNCTRRIQ